MYVQVVVVLAAMVISHAVAARKFSVEISLLAMAIVGVSLCL